jgi:two-component system KDP operon response regulator KdpE
MSHRILIIDDDLGLLALLQQWLELEGYAVVAAQGGREGIHKADGIRPDLIILDIMMPEMDGWITYQELRRVCEAPIIVLTAVATEESIAKGMALGVDDYMTKPCSFEELRLRIREAIGRGAADHRLVVFDDGRLHVDLVNGASVQNGEPIHLSPTESRLLLYLARRRGRTVSYEELLVNVWGPEYAEEVTYLDTYVRHLCQKIEDDPDHPRYISPNRSQGYRFADSRIMVSGQ